MIIFVGGGQGEGYWGHILPKTPKIALISECLAADSSPDASADALAIINIRNFEIRRKHFLNLFSFFRILSRLILSWTYWTKCRQFRLLLRLSLLMENEVSEAKRRRHFDLASHRFTDNTHNFAFFESDFAAVKTGLKSRQRSLRVQS